MKPVFKCDYCKFVGTEEEVKEHEQNCMCNYNRNSCHTCEYKEVDFNKNGKIIYKCKVDMDIPEGKIYEFCKSYKEKKRSNYFDDLFGNIF